MSSWFFTEKTFSRAEVLDYVCVVSFQTHDYKYNRTAFLLTERRSSSVTFKTWVRFPSAPPREYMFKVNYKSSSHASKRSVTFTKMFKTLEDVTVFLSSLEPLRFISCKKLWVLEKYGMAQVSLKDPPQLAGWKREMRLGNAQRKLGKLRNTTRNISIRIGIRICGTNRSMVMADLFLHHLWMDNARSNFWGLYTHY